MNLRFARLNMHAWLRTLDTGRHLHLDGRQPRPSRREGPALGSAAPDFKLQDQAGKWHQLKDYRGKWVALYFYPKDKTPGCTTQACEFRDNVFAFRDANAVILGVSVDDVESHKEFSEKHGLPFPILRGRSESRRQGVRRAEAASLGRSSWRSAIRF